MRHTLPFLLVGLSALLAPLCAVADDFKNESSSKAQLDAGVTQGTTGEVSGEMFSEQQKSEDVTQVFFAGGQSNATRQWAAMIERELKKVYGQHAVLVHSNHGGAWLNRWFKSGAIQKCYLVDFHDAKGTGALQKTTTFLEKQGKPWRLSGVFWLQGEGDSGSDAAIKQYSATFNGMMAQVNKDFGINYEYARVFAVIDGNHEK
jgi:hypothetical protein